MTCARLLSMVMRIGVYTLVCPLAASADPMFMGLGSLGGSSPAEFQSAALDDVLAAERESQARMRQPAPNTLAA